jgi:tRNA(fMet)-specific endonuclease VapC
VAFLFDTNSISEVFRPRPNRAFCSWLEEVPREEQFTSMVVIAELYGAAFRASNPQKWRERIEHGVLAAMTVLSFDLACAREYGRLHGDLARRGKPIGTADVQIAATARVHGLTVVTANSRPYERVRGLDLKIFTPGEDSQR